MKNHSLFFILAVLLLCFSAVSAQDSDTELSLATVGNLFRWSDSRQGIIDSLKQFADFTLNEESDGSISVEKNTEEKRTYCFFRFDEASDLFSGIECVDIYYNDEASFEMADSVIEAYDLLGADLFENEYTNEYIADLDGAMVRAGNETICILGGNDPSDEYYGFLTLVFLNRDFQ